MEVRNKMTLQALCEEEGTTIINKFDFLGKDGKEHYYFSLGSKKIIMASDRAQKQILEGKAAHDEGNVEKAKACFRNIQYAEYKKEDLPDYDEQGRCNWIPLLSIYNSQQNQQEHMKKRNYIKELNYGNVTVVENRDYQWAVIDSQGNFVVPFGKYGWIDGFDSGLARVRSKGNTGRAGHTVAIINLSESTPFAIQGKDAIQKFYDKDRQIHPDKYAKWGIINERGEEVLPVIYDEVLNFLGKNRYSTKVEKNGVESDVYFHDLNPDLPVRGVGRRYNDFEDEYEYNPMYDYDESYTWYAMTDGMYGDMPEGFDGDYSFIGY